MQNCPETVLLVLASHGLGLSNSHSEGGEKGAEATQNETMGYSVASSYIVWHSSTFRSLDFGQVLAGYFKSYNYCSFPVFIAALANHAVLLVVLSSGHCTVDNSLETRFTHYIKG